MNLIKITGNLVNKPELTFCEESRRYLYQFCVAVNRPNGSGLTDFIPCCANITHGDKNDMKLKYFNKGDKIQVTGALTTRRYEDRYKQKRTAFEIECNEIAYGF